MGNTGWLPYCGSVTWTDDSDDSPPRKTNKIEPLFKLIPLVTFFCKENHGSFSGFLYPTQGTIRSTQTWFFFSKFGYVSSTQRVYLSCKGPAPLPFSLMKLSTTTPKKNGLKNKWVLLRLWGPYTIGVRLLFITGGYKAHLVGVYTCVFFVECTATWKQGQNVDVEYVYTIYVYIYFYIIIYYIDLFEGSWMILRGSIHIISLFQ